MIVPDINLLLYAYDTRSPFHAKAGPWWTNCLSGTEAVGLLHVVVFGFVRIATHPRVFTHPMTAAEATGHVRTWLARPQVEVLSPGSRHLEQTLELLCGLGTAANLVGDAQITAMVMDHHAVLHTADTDFARFEGLRCFNPLASTPGGRSGPRRRP